MSLAPLKTTTALVASLSLILPHHSFVATAWAQEAELLCLDESQPPCPEGEPEEGSTAAERAEFAAAAEAEALTQEEAEAAEAEAQAAEQAEAAEAAEALAAEEEAAEAEALAAEEAAATEAEAAEAEALAQEEAEAAEAAAEAEAEAEALAAEEAAAVEAEALAAEEAEAAEAAEAEAAQAEAEAEAVAAEVAAAVEAEALTAEEAAAAAEAAEESEAMAAEETEATEVEEEADVAAAEEAAAEEAEALAPEDTDSTEPTDTEAEAMPAEEDAATENDGVPAEEEAATQADALDAEAEASGQSEIVLDDPTVTEEAEAPVAATVESEATPEQVVEETLDEDAVRTSQEDFETPITGNQATATQNNDRDGLSNIEKALLLGLGAVVVGSVLRNGDRVVENTGDRVVVEGTRGLTIYKDDDALLRQPGASIRTETFSDGSTRTFLDRDDGTQVVTIRDSRGRVLRRDVLYPDGTQIELFDDVEPVPAVDVQRLQDMGPGARSLSAADSDIRALRAALAETLAVDAGRNFSLRQIREIEQVRSLVPAIDLDTVNFASGSAAIPPRQARSLAQIGSLIEDTLLDDPREVFLIEGHTDAIGSDSYNLALSDRRAESVALALTENFRIPPENLIVQGYGEAFPKVDTQQAEPANRRATVRRITPLLR